MEDETGSEETSSELRDDQTDTSSAEVPSARPRRAVTLRSSSELDRPAPTERARRSRRPQPHSYSETEKCAQVKEVSMRLPLLINRNILPKLTKPCSSEEDIPALVHHKHSFLYESFFSFCRKLSKKRKRSSSWTVIHWSGLWLMSWGLLNWLTVHRLPKYFKSR